jgi:arylsulfatase A-like enzyme
MAAGALIAEARDADRPNILWLTCEDNNVDWVGCYGNPHADTPNIDRLAEEGFQYMHCYANAPVCAPSRSTWITGMLSISNGTFPMRSRNEIPHDRIKYYPDLLRAAGYYTGNDKKTDYNIGGRKDGDCWDNQGKVDWNALKENQPFFQIINDTASHESKAQGDVENTDHDPADTKLRAYHPDLPDMRKNYAKYHDAMKRMDTNLGAALNKLEAMGLAENTIVIHNSDHGGVLPRSKRFLFQTGIHCPLIVRIPKKYKHLWPAGKPGTKIDRLVSFVDMPRTWLSLTGSEQPDYLHGTIFLGPQIEPENEFHFAFRGRMDGRMDNARAVCDKQYLYIRNYMPYVPWMQHLQYLWKMRATQVWEEHVKAGKATEVQSRYFVPKGRAEELYDMRKDPDNVVNLIDNPQYRQVAERMRSELRRQQLKVIDSGLLPESEMIKRAEDNGITIHEMVRDPKLYNLPALLDAADLALARNEEDLPALRKLLDSKDSGLRYWGMVGCFLLNDHQTGLRGIIDESHEVRAMAAWLLINTGEKEKGLQCLEDLLKQDSYATLAVLNIIDWMGADGKALMPTVEALQPEEKSYEERTRSILLSKFEDT